MENRTIKFRGKRIDNGEWIEGDLVQWEEVGKCAIIPQNGHQWKTPDDFEVIPESVGQFTGRTDKNNVDCFEGNTISYRDAYGQNTGEIVWWNDRWALKYVANGFDQYQSLMTVKNFEIIGNTSTTKKAG